MSEKCPTGCGRVVQFGHLTCKTCWYEIPKELRDRVNATWEKYSKLHRPLPDGRGERQAARGPHRLPGRAQRGPSLHQVSTVYERVEPDAQEDPR